MSYKEAMEAAGATVLAYKRFGSYQGDWLAKVVYQGETFYVQGAYGSCSGCDSFDATFRYNEGNCSEHEYEYDTRPEDCTGCVVARADYQARLATFGLSYLNDPRTKEELVTKFTQDSEWDMGSPEVLDWLKNN